MGWAEERALQIKAAQEAEEASNQRAIQAQTAISNNADDLWELLVSGLETNTKEFAEALPLAKQSGLRAHRFNSNNITIMTNVFPLIHFEIIYRRGAYVEGLLKETFAGLSPTQTKQLGKIRFTVDRKMQPCFTDGERYLHPSQIANELMEKVAEFFEAAMRRPSFLT